MYIPLSSQDINEENKISNHIFIQWVRTFSHNSEHLANHKYRADIDGLRAIAILCVVGFHAFPEWVKGGFIGVDIFFVISGFLISTIIYESIDRNSFSLVGFYTRRIRRIFPALFLVLIACFVFGWFALLAGEYKQLGKHIAGGAGFISNFVYLNESGYFDNIAETKPLLHLWSLGVEEQFYFIWPIFLWLAWRAQNANSVFLGGLGKKLNLLKITIYIGIISFVLNVAEVNYNSVAAYYSPQTRFWELMSGSTLAYVTLYKKVILPRFMYVFDSWLRSMAMHKYEEWMCDLKSVFGVVLIVVGVLVIAKENAFPGWWAILPTLGAVLIISAGANAWINRVILSSRVLVWFGLISFPLYLWHWPLLSFAHILESGTPSSEIRFAVILVSIVLAWLTYRLIEKPIRFGNYGKVKTTILVMLMVAIGIVGYNTYKLEGLKYRKVVLSNPDTDLNIHILSNASSPCTNEDIYALASKFCTRFAAINPNKTIVLWGDSSTGAWLPVFLDIAKQKNYTLINISHPSCPPILKARKTRF